MAAPQKAPIRKSIAFFGAEGICELNGRFPNAPSFEKQPAEHGGVLCPANARRPFAPAMEASAIVVVEREGERNPLPMGGLPEPEFAPRDGCMVNSQTAVSFDVDLA